MSCQCQVQNLVHYLISKFRSFSCLTKWLIVAKGTELWLQCSAIFSHRHTFIKILFRIRLLTSNQLTRSAMHWSGFNAQSCLPWAVMLSALHKRVRIMQASLLKEMYDTDGYTQVTAE